MSPELQAKITYWRQLSLDGKLDADTLAEAVKAMRAERVGAQVASDKSRRAKAKAEIPSADDLLAEMGLASPSDPS